MSNPKVSKGSKPAIIGAPDYKNPKTLGQPVWAIRDKKANYLGPQGSAKKCNVEKPCTNGAGLKWDAKALGVDKAAKRDFQKAGFSTKSDAMTQFPINN